MFSYVKKLHLWASAHHCMKALIWSIMKANGHPVLTMPSITSYSEASYASKSSSLKTVPYFSNSNLFIGTNTSLVKVCSFVFFHPSLPCLYKTSLWSLMSSLAWLWLKNSLSSPQRLSVHSESPWTIWPIFSQYGKSVPSHLIAFALTVKRTSPS